jgi:hypothetical protein
LIICLGVILENNTEAGVDGRTLVPPSERRPDSGGNGAGQGQGEAGEVAFAHFLGMLADFALSVDDFGARGKYILAITKVTKQVMFLILQEASFRRA